MPRRMICTLPNASLTLDGLEWEPCKSGIITKSFIDDDVADRLLSIPGFENGKTQTKVAAVEEGVAQ